MRGPRPLHGRTIVVTRPEGQGEALAKRLRGHGARVVLAPAIAIYPPRSLKALDLALRRLEDFDAVVFTSANAVERFFERSRNLALPNFSRPRRLYAIGPETASALKNAGWPRARMPTSHNGEALARLMASSSRGKKILIPRARITREILPRLLREAGAAVSTVEAYRTLPNRAGLKKILDLPPTAIDAVTFTSESTVKHLFSGLGRRRCRELFKGSAAASIGPITTSSLLKHGVRPAIVARAATAAALASAIVRYFRE